MFVYVMGPGIISGKSMIPVLKALIHAAQIFRPSLQLHNGIPGQIGRVKAQGF